MLLSVEQKLSVDLSCHNRTLEEQRTAAYQLGLTLHTCLTGGKCPFIWNPKHLHKVRIHSAAMSMPCASKGCFAVLFHPLCCCLWPLHVIMNACKGVWLISLPKPPWNTGIAPPVRGSDTGFDCCFRFDAQFVHACVGSDAVQVVMGTESLRSRPDQTLSARGCRQEAVSGCCGSAS